MWILLLFLWSLILSIIMIVRVKNHKVVKRPKLVLYLNILNLLVLTLWVLLMFIVWQSRDGLATLLWYLIISIPLLVINIVQYRRGLRKDFVKELSPKELYELYEDTLHQCGSHIFDYPDDIIETMVFEDFDIGVHSFLHDDSLNTLFNNHLIDKKQYDLSRRIRELFLEIEDCGELTMECLKGQSEKWKHLIFLVDEAVSIL
ncbi:MAG: hypothetical protein J6P65_03975 [Bacteroidales bacterium]|nr:hypothetical protein [Bacteroidales bacterium]